MVHEFHILQPFVGRGGEWFFSLGIAGRLGRVNIGSSVLCTPMVDALGFVVRLLLSWMYLGHGWQDYMIRLSSRSWRTTRSMIRGHTLRRAST